ncbi:MAG: hypothetical protein IJX99_09120 [Clostridia bacterium]|nr:hypothetical protein [Clostridia bacterium]
MKKMLDELKKLDVDYEVPADFSKKVMERIKNENIENTEKSKGNVSYLRKYVIPWTSAVAVLMVVAIVTIGGTVRDKSSNESASINFSGAMNDTISAAQSADNKVMEGAVAESSVNSAIKDKNDIFDFVFDIAKDANDSVVMDEIENEIPSATMKDNVEMQNTRVEGVLTIEVISELLKENSIEFELEDDFIILMNEDFEVISDILKKVEKDIEITEEENIIKINLK